MIISRSYLQLINFNNVSASYLAKNKEGENKLCSAINRFNKQLKTIFEEYNDERDTLQLNNCVVDEKTKVILKDATGNRQFTVDGEMKLKKGLKELVKKTVECHDRIPEGIDDIISSLSDFEKEAFSGIVIPEQTDELPDGF